MNRFNNDYSSFLFTHGIRLVHFPSSNECLDSDVNAHNPHSIVHRYRTRIPQSAPNAMIFFVCPILRQICIDRVQSANTKAEAQTRVHRRMLRRTRTPHTLLPLTTAILLISALVSVCAVYALRGCVFVCVCSSVCVIQCIETLRGLLKCSFIGSFHFFPLSLFANAAAVVAAASSSWTFTYKHDSTILKHQNQTINAHNRERLGEWVTEEEGKRIYEW